MGVAHRYVGWPRWGRDGVSWPRWGRDGVGPGMLAKTLFRLKSHRVPQSLHIAPVHIVFSTKNREPYIAEAIRANLWAYLAKCLQNQKCFTITVGGVADHVHILCHFTKHASAVEVMQRLKQDSSKFVKTLDPNLERFRWQDGYGFFGLSPSHVDSVRQYVLNQEEHHQKVTFQDEYRRLLQKYDVEYDERYVWD